MASGLGFALARQGINIMQVYNRTREKGRKLAASLGAAYIEDIHAIDPNADLYILAIPDSAIENVSTGLHLKYQLVVHTSGSMDMKILSKASGNTGVLYPLQTFSQRRRVNFRHIPLCLEANSESGEKKLGELAARLSGIVHYVNSDNRKILHLAAVFSSNFTNFMVTIAEELLLTHDMPFDLIKPIIRQTIRNIEHVPIFRNQTGPAVRGDEKVLDTHRELLKEDPDYLEIYNVITNNIIKYKSFHGKL